MPASTNPLRVLRQSHENLVLSHLRTAGSSSRAELVTRSGLSRTTMSAVVRELIARGMVVEKAPGEDGVRTAGRPATTLSLNPAAGIAIGIGFRHRGVSVALANVAHEVVGTRSATHDADLTPEVRLEKAVSLVEDVVATTGHELRALHGIGVGLIGRSASWDNDMMIARLSDRFGAEVKTANSARLAGLAEWTWGAASGLSDVVFIRLSAGIGGALILDGRLYRGPSGTSGAFGDVCVDPEGLPCRCGNRGCLQTLASMDAMLMRAADIGAATIAELGAAEDRGDRRAEAIITQAGAALGLVLAGTCNVTGVHDFVIGGEVSELGERLLAPARAAMRHHLASDSFAQLSLRPAVLGDADGAMGGIALVLQDEAPMVPWAPALLRVGQVDTPASVSER